MIKYHDIQILSVSPFRYEMSVKKVFRIGRWCHDGFFLSLLLLFFFHGQHQQLIDGGVHGPFVAAKNILSNRIKSELKTKRREVVIIIEHTSITSGSISGNMTRKSSMAWLKSKWVVFSTVSGVTARAPSSSSYNSIVVIILNCPTSNTWINIQIGNFIQQDLHQEHFYYFNCLIFTIWWVARYPQVQLIGSQ